jgi:hypothetical protein
VTGAQVFWHPPVDGLRIGGTFLRTSIDFYLTFDPATLSSLVAAGLVPPDYDGHLRISQRPATLWLASAEYERGDWLFAAEYGRQRTRQVSDLPDLLPLSKTEGENYYGLVTRRLSTWLAAGAYYSVHVLDVSDRHGKDTTRFPKAYDAWQRDLAVSLRFDVDDHWLWKVEGHFIDGAADLDVGLDPDPDRYWGLFLVKTTVTF